MGRSGLRRPCPRLGRNGLGHRRTRAGGAEGNPRRPSGDDPGSGEGDRRYAPEGRAHHDGARLVDDLSLPHLLRHVLQSQPGFHRSTRDPSWSARRTGSASARREPPSPPKCRAPSASRKPATTTAMWARGRPAPRSPTSPSVPAAESGESRLAISSTDFSLLRDQRRRPQATAAAVAASRRISSAREVIPSFANTLRKWYSTVRGLRNS